MTLSRLATVSKDGHTSFGRVQPELPESALGLRLQSALFADAASRQVFEAQLPPEFKAEWDSLGLENNPELFFNDLIGLAQRLQKKQPEQAAQLFGAVSAWPSQDPDLLSEQRSKAEAHYLALTGQGALGPRAELFIANFTKEACDPASLVAMGLAPHVFRWARLWTASRIGASSLLSRGIANGTGLLAESTAFTFTHKGIATALDRPQNWDPSSLAQEWSAGALFLGSLKVSGGMAKQALGHYALTFPPSIARYLAEGVSQTSLTLGILAGHGLQEFFGLKKKATGPEMWAETLSTLLHLHVGGRLVNTVLGPHYVASLKKNDLAYESLRRPTDGAKPRGKLDSILDAYEFDDLPTLPHSRPAFATANRMQPFEPRQTHALMMAGEAPGGGKKFQFTMEDLSKLGKFYASLSIMEAEALDIHYRDQRHQFLFCRLLQNIAFPDPIARTHAFTKLGHALKHSNDNALAGSYVNWLTRKTVDVFLESQDTNRASQLLGLMVEGGRLREFEKLAAEVLPPARFTFLPPWLTKSGRAQYPNYERIQALPLISEEAKDVLFRMIYTQAKAKEVQPHFLSEQEFLDRIGQALFHPGYGELISKALVTALRSPLAFYRLQRLHALLGNIDALTPSKLMEISDPYYQLVGRRHPELPVPLFGKSRPAQFNGYMGDKAPLDTLLELRRRQNDLLDPQRAAARKEDRTKLLEQLHAQRSRLDPATPAFWAYGFKLLGDPLSKRIAADLEAGKFELQVLGYEDFKKRCLELDMADGIHDNAFFLHSGVTGGKPLMLVKETGTDYYSHKTRNDPLFLAFAKIVHEYQHFLDINPAEPRTMGVVHRQEMHAHLREALWRAQYGDMGKLEAYLRDGTGGHAQHWRDLFESLYGHHFKRD